MASASREGDVTREFVVSRQPFYLIARQSMLNSIDTFDVPTRVRELELSIARRVREALQPFIGDPELLEDTAREVLLISRDYAGSFQAINNRARIRQERAAE